MGRQNLRQRRHISRLLVRRSIRQARTKRLQEMEWAAYIRWYRGACLEWCTYVQAL